MSTILTRRDLPDFRTLSEALPHCFRDILLLVRRDDGRLLDANDAAVNAYGYSREELLSLTIYDLRVQDPRTVVAAQLQTVDERGVLFEAVHRRSDGTSFPVEVSAQGAVVGGTHTVISVIRDISRRRQAEDALRRSEAQLRMQMDRLPIGCIVHDEQHRVMQLNPAAERIFGYSSGELQGRHASVLVADDARPHLDTILARLNEGDMAAHSVHENVTKDERTIVCQWTNTPLLGGDGVLYGFLSMVQDVTDRHRAEEALRRSEARWNAAVEHMGVGLVYATEGGQVIYWNPAARQLHGFTSDGEGIGPLADTPNTFQLWTRDGARLLPLEERPMSRLLRGETVRHLELRLRRPDQGWEKIVSYSGAMVDTASGEHLVCLSVHDLTEQRRAEWALRRSEHFYRQTLESIPGMVFTTRPDGYCDYQSQQWVEFTGVPMAEHLGDGWNRLLHPDDRPRAFAAWRAAVEGRAPYDLEYRVRRRDGEYEWFKVRGEPIRDRDGTIVRWFGVATNIDAMKQAERQLAAATAAAEEARSAAESANRAKDQFLAVLSHELRTPLTPAVAAMSLLRTDVRLPADVREDLKMVSRNLDLEVRLIADLLDVSRVISGKLYLEKRAVDVAAAIREAAAIVRGDLDAKGQSLAVDLEGTPYLAAADAARLQQVFWNLLRNSVKFSPPRSHITIRGRVLPLQRCPLAWSQPCAVGKGDCPLPPAAGALPGGNLVVEVIDNGSGIDADMVPKLFNVFEQEQKARSFGGLGLGLSICKAVVEMHGGTIYARSEGRGRGSTFTVRLPVAQCALAAAVERPAPPVPAETVPHLHAAGRPLRVLVVEDHEDTAMMMQVLLRLEGHDVVLAGSVAAGLAAAAEHEPDLLISDVGLPDGSGLDLMQQLIARGDHLPAIALSGYGTPADIEKSKAAGFLEHLVKPLNGVESLAAAIARAGVQPR
jgi:PAS domain S-box-containing protein